MKSILVFLIIFSVIVIVHEFGHFYFARKSGILVREFSIGMGPKVFAKQGKDGVDPMELYSSLILGFDIACTG